MNSETAETAPRYAWDYLILTASHADQAAAYETQLAVRRQIGRLDSVRECMVVADLDGRRIGSGGSTLDCLLRVVNREIARTGPAPAEEILRRLRILIVHAGGDSRRLPAYGPAGKIFVPVPGRCDSALALTLFDLLTPPFLRLPAPPAGVGQIVVAAGDALLRFPAEAVRFESRGITMLAGRATPEEASRHGVFCMGPGGSVRLYLQKPPLAEQVRLGALDSTGHAALDIAVTQLDSSSAARLLDAFEARPTASGELAWSPLMRALLLDRGIDLYREICCAMGTDATFDHYLRSLRQAGSKWSEAALERVFPLLRAVPFHAQLLDGCRFLHFGATRQLVSSGVALLTLDHSTAPADQCLALNNQLGADGSISGAESWVEGCRIEAPITLAGNNVLIGVDIDAPLALPLAASLDVVEGRGVFFIRCYGTGDSFKDATFCGRPLADWLAQANASESDVWPADLPATERTLWTARVFPAESAARGFRKWLWMFTPEIATVEQKRAWRDAPRHSAAEIALLADQDAFHRRRAALRAHEVEQSLEALFAPESAFSAADLAFAIGHSADPERLIAAVRSLAERAVNQPRLQARILAALAQSVAPASV